MNYWVEISELDHGHGGAGWELGSCLWSPTLDRNGRNRYRMVREVKNGDPVFHLIRHNGDRALVGRSTASGPAATVTETPPEPGKWSGFPSYFRVQLKDFKAFDPPPVLKDIEAAHWEQIRSDITPQRPSHHPYVTYGQGVRIVQGQYIALLTNKMLELFNFYVGESPSEGGLTAAANDLAQYQEGADFD